MEVAMLSNVYLYSLVEGISVNQKHGRSGAMTRYLWARMKMRLRHWWEELGNPWKRRITGASIGPASR